MKKGMYIDLDNIEQVRWFNKTSGKLFRVTHYDKIVETSTNKTVGFCMTIKSLFSNYVIKKNNSFLGNNLKELVVIKTES